MAKKKSASEIKVYCAHDKLVPIGEVKPNPKNPNTHPQGQIEILAKVIQEQGWRQPIKVSNQSGYIVSGHGRYEAAIFMGAEYVPVDYQDYESEAAELADLLADNRIAELAETDNAKLAELFKDVQVKGFDTDVTGFMNDEIQNIFAKFSEPNFDELDNDAEIEETVTVKITFDTYKEYARFENEIKDFVSKIGAKMVVTQ